MESVARGKSGKGGTWGVLAAIGLFFLSKLKWVLGLLKLGKFATLASMFVSLWAHAQIFGWKFASAIIYLIFVHEMGHLVAARMKKIPTSPAIFIPFMGAVIGIDPKKIKNAETEFFVAYGGPFAGLLSIIPAALLYLYTKDPYWALVMQLGALINLFNLIPVSPLDGGRIVSVLSTKVWFIGLLALVPFLFLSPDPVLMIIFIFGVITWVERIREPLKIKTMNYKKEVLQNINELLDTYKSRTITGIDFELYTDEFEYKLNEYARIRTILRERKQEVVDFVIHDPTVRGLFVRPKHKPKVKKMEAELEILKQILEKNMFPTVNSATAIDEIVELVYEQNQKKTAELNDELSRMKTYYESSLTTKIRALILYVALAVLLAVILVFAMEILDASDLMVNPTSFEEN
ncbi:site-2 protease family protein [Radiobacillus deserti]|uniref:Site-2 protease family protein n=1 Tax=Radiobacillus deserti TaxID=2594883 RepID=A0A516KDT1_9BACI|nr:site-2 protease family protein [Radiobacillus deserti]QDP39572.1 site-2 protease family protein [Radiobacillus deserti]